MGSSRKKVKRCIECGGSMKLTSLEEKGITFEGYKCEKCNHAIVTIEQMHFYEKAKALKDALPLKRKIVKIGNSLGFTLPITLAKYGLKIGRELEIKILDESNIKITLL
jgi:hypothetical protein